MNNDFFLEKIDNSLSNVDISLFSKKTQKLIKKWQNDKKPIQRLTWTHYFLSLSWLISLRSVDSRTKCGAVITDKNNIIVSTGYNGMLRDIDDRILPNFGDSKYQFMIHAELNAILNAAKHGKSTQDTNFYLSSPPCIACLQSIWQCGGKNIYYIANNIPHMLRIKEYNQHLFLFKKLTNKQLTITPVQFNKKEIINFLQKGIQC